MNYLFWIVFLIVITERLVELVVARRNEKYVKAHGAKEYDSKGYKFIVLMHIAFFISLLLEYVLLNKGLNKFWIPLIILFILAQILRYWAITSLGYYWNTKILVIPNSTRVTEGPYRYLKHPNYLAVVIEIATIPLTFSCYFTAGIFTILNIFLVRRRIFIEEAALSSTVL